MWTFTDELCEQMLRILATNLGAGLYVMLMAVLNHYLGTYALVIFRDPI